MAKVDDFLYVRERQILIPKLSERCTKGIAQL